MRFSRIGIFVSAIAFVVLCIGAGPARAQAGDAGGIDKKVTLNLKDVPLRSAIELLFAGSGLQYSIDPVVQNVPVSLSIRDVSLQAALRLVIRQASTLQPGLTVTREGDIFVVRVRPPAAPTTTPTEEAPPEDTGVGEITWEKIPIQFNSVMAFVAAFGGDRIPTELDVLGMSGGGMGGMGGGMGGGMMGGMGGMGGGMMGGMGGMGGGMMGGMGGMGGGMMGGGMGGMGGGMGGMGGGGMGGFGGGRF